MSDLEDLLNQKLSEEELIEWKKSYRKIWKRDIRDIADLIKEHFEDPQSLLENLVKHVQEARAEGFPKNNFH